MNQLIQPMQQLAQLTGDVVAAEAEILHAFGWSPAQSRTGSVKAVGTGPHKGQTLYGTRAQAALAAKGAKAKPEPAKKEKVKGGGSKAPTTEARMELNVKKATAVATEHLRAADAAMKAGDAKKAQGLRAAAYGMNRAAKYIEDGDLVKARAAVELAGQFARGERQLRAEPKPGSPAAKSAIAFRGKGPSADPVKAVAGVYERAAGATDAEIAATRDALSKMPTADVQKAAAAVGMVGTATAADVLRRIEERRGATTRRKLIGKTLPLKPELAEHAKAVRAVIERDKKEPGKVTDAEVDAALAPLAKLPKEDLFALAKEVTGRGGRSVQDSLNLLRADMTAVRRLLESQRV
jgi:hypothetical protein